MDIEDNTDRFYCVITVKSFKRGPRISIFIHCFKNTCKFFTCAKFAHSKYPPHTSRPSA